MPGWRARVSATLLLMVRFAARHGAGTAAGVAGALLLLSSPRVFAHGMSNLKDVPETLLFTAALFVAYGLATSPRRCVDCRDWVAC